MIRNMSTTNIHHTRVLVGHIHVYLFTLVLSFSPFLVLSLISISHLPLTSFSHISLACLSYLLLPFPLVSPLSSLLAPKAYLSTSHSHTLRCPCHAAQ